MTARSQPPKAARPKSVIRHTFGVKRNQTAIDGVLHRIVPLGPIQRAVKGDDGRLHLEQIATACRVEPATETE